MLLKFARKWYPLVIIVSVLAFWLVANAIWHTPPKKTVVVSFDSYSILKAEDQYYLRIHEEANILNRTMSAVPLTSIAPDPNPKFVSAKSMKDSILGGTLTKEHLYYIWKHCLFDGDNDFYICDPYDIHEPFEPSDLHDYGVTWYGTYYRFHYKASNDYSMSIDCYELTKEHSVSGYIKNSIKNYQDRIYKTEQTPNGNATIYYYAYDNGDAHKICTYDVSTDSKQLMILERYPTVSSEIPSTTRICGIENGVYFEGYIESRNERPSVEFLQNIGISPDPIP